MPVEEKKRIKGINLESQKNHNTVTHKPNCPYPNGTDRNRLRFVFVSMGSDQNCGSWRVTVRHRHDPHSASLETNSMGWDERVYGWQCPRKHKTPFKTLHTYFYSGCSIAFPPWCSMTETRKFKATIMRQKVELIVSPKQRAHACGFYTIVEIQPGSSSGRGKDVRRRSDNVPQDSVISLQMELNVQPQFSSGKVTCKLQQLSTYSWHASKNRNLTLQSARSRLLTKLMLKRE